MPIKVIYFLSTRNTCYKHLDRYYKMKSQELDTISLISSLNTIPLGIVIWWLLDSPLVCFSSLGWQQIYLPEAQQKLLFRRIWNLWETLLSGSFVSLLRASVKQFDDLKDTQTTMLNTTNARPIPKPPTIHPYGIWPLWSLGFSWFTGNKLHANRYFLTRNKCSSMARSLTHNWKNLRENKTSRKYQ